MSNHADLAARLISPANQFLFSDDKAAEIGTALLNEAAAALSREPVVPAAQSEGLDADLAWLRSLVRDNNTGRRIDSIVARLTSKPSAPAGEPVVPAAGDAGREFPRGPIEQERIVAAAYKFADGEVRIGLRHGDPFMRRGMDRPVEQGFVTNRRGRFVDRKVAWAIALAAGQLMRQHLPDDQLDSSDVW